jgi:hypothetical protein
VTQLFSFPAAWIGGAEFEQVLADRPDPRMSHDSNVAFVIQPDTKIRVDAAVRLLSFANQLQNGGRSVTLEFSSPDSRALSYLGRMGFFELLNPRIQVSPHRPDGAAMQRYRGRNEALVEFARLRLGMRDDDLPGKLRAALISKVRNKQRRTDLGKTAFTLFGELIDNVYQHSSTTLDGIAVLQVYPNGGQVIVAVSDSGVGLLESLRPTLAKHYPDLAGAKDTELLVHMLHNGVSRFGAPHGLGLKCSAACALEHGADLDVRLPYSYYRLKAKRGGKYRTTTETSDRRTLIQGTHIAFDFRLN